MLVNTARMRAVRVDPATRIARVPGGGALVRRDPGSRGPRSRLPARVELAGVGVVGYTMGGGFGWFGRRYGLAAESAARGRGRDRRRWLVRAAADENADLFWALPGGGGNFGVVTALEFALHPVAHVYAATFLPGRTGA